MSAQPQREEKSPSHTGPLPQLRPAGSAPTILPLAASATSATSASSSSGVSPQHRSPPGSPSRALLSRLSMSESPRTRTRSTTAMQLAAKQAQSALGQAAARAHGVEQAGENAPYALPLGTRDVTLADKYLKDEGCVRLAHELLGRGSELDLHTLDLRGNDIRRYGAEALGELLREGGGSIERLNLEWNWLGDGGGAGLEALCDALRTNRSLTFLDLRNNKLNSECGVAIARLLICNRTLQELDLRWNNLGGPGGAAIADALVRNQHVRRIALSGNRIPASTVKAIEEALAKNRELNLLGDRLPAKKQGMSDSEAERLLRAEQQVHDLHRELARVQAQAARTEQELVDEHRRCDELTEALASLRDESAAAKQQARKNYTLLQSDLERAQTALFDRSRLADADALTVKTQLAELTRLQSELAMVSEDRARLLLAREQTSSTLNAQIESQHAEWAKLNELLQSKERAWMEERGEWEQKLAHQKRMGDSDKETALSAAMERGRALQLELSREKEDHTSQMAELGSRLRALQESSGDTTSTVLSLREQLVAQSLAHEEALAKMERDHRAEGSGAQAKALSAMEGRLASLQAARDELVRQNELQVKELARERADHAAALEAERAVRSNAAASSAATASENYTLKARLMDQEHRASLLSSQLEAAQHSLSEQARRNQEQVEQVYARARSDLRAVERTLRTEQEEKMRMAARIKMLEDRLAAAEAEQNARSQSLVSALSALKSSVSVVDQSVQGSIKHAPPPTTTTVDSARPAVERSSSASAAHATGGSSSHRHHHRSSERRSSEYDNSSLPASPSSRSRHYHGSSSSSGHRAHASSSSRHHSGGLDSSRGDVGAGAGHTSERHSHRSSTEHRSSHRHDRERRSSRSPSRRGSRSPPRRSSRSPSRRSSSTSHRHSTEAPAPSTYTSGTDTHSRAQVQPLPHAQQQQIQAPLAAPKPTVAPLPLSSLVRSQHASPQQVQRSLPPASAPAAVAAPAPAPAPQRIEQRRVVAPEESSLGDVGTGEGSLSYEEDDGDIDVEDDHDDHAQEESQSMAQESQSMAHSRSYAQQPQEQEAEEEVEISFDEDE